MPTPRSGPRKPKVKVEVLRKQLLEVNDSQLKSLRLTGKARTVLPYLATEVNNEALRHRVLTLAVRAVNNFTWSELARLIPYLYEDEQFRGLVFSRARKERGLLPERPRWLSRFGGRVLGTSSPARALATSALQEQPVVARLLKWLQLRPGTPLGIATLRETLLLVDDETLFSQPYTETLRFIERGAGDAVVARALLLRILDRYAPLVSSQDELLRRPELQELAQLTLARLQGGPDQSPGLWQGSGAAAKRFGRWAAMLEPPEPGGL